MADSRGPEGDADPSETAGGDSGSGSDSGSEAGTAADDGEELSTAELRARVEEQYDFEEFGAEEMAEIDRKSVV